MFDSLRVRLLVWYTTLLAVVIVAFGATMCYLAWHARLAEIDATLLARAQTLALALRPAAEGTFDLTLPPALPTDDVQAPYHVLWSERGVPIDRSDPDLAVPMPDGLGGRTREGRREMAVRAASGATVLAGQSLATARAEVWSLAGTVAALGVAALIVSFAGGWWLVGRALRPIDRISDTARTMVGGDFTARIPIHRVETELEELARALNEAFDRLHGSLERQRRFTADASHELRTPLATLSTEVQWALGRDRQPEDYRRALEVCRRAAGRMQTVVERLLALARAEAGADSDRRIPVQLDDLARQVASDLRPLAEARHITIDAETTPVTVSGDPDRLFDALTNVVANAIGYNVENGHVRITVRERNGDAELLVTDTGVGIAADDLPRIFDPFFRADPARNRGAGLGLAVTRAVIESHGGRVTCESGVGQGTTVAMHLAAAIHETPPAL
jgi:signal transduction histidine kinase